MDHIQASKIAQGFEQTIQATPAGASVIASAPPAPLLVKPVDHSDLKPKAPQVRKEMEDR